MTTLTIKGQVTIPKRIRTALALEPGHAVAFDVNEAGEVVLRKVGGARETRAPGPTGPFPRLRFVTPSATAP